MKKFLLLLFIFTLLIGCTNVNEEKEEGTNDENTSSLTTDNGEKEEAQSITGDTTEGFKLIHEQAHNNVVYEDDKITLSLVQSIHGRSDTRDLIELKFSVENKTDDEYNLNFDYIMFDEQNIEGSKINMFGTNVPSDETTVLDVMVANENEMQFEQEIFGEFRLKDGEREENIEFSKEIEYE